MNRAHAYPWKLHPRQFEMVSSVEWIVIFLKPMSFEPTAMAQVSFPVDAIR